MSQPVPSQDCDSLLQRFLRAADEAEAEKCLADLLSIHAAPTIKRILNSELRLHSVRDSHPHPHAEDVHGEVMVHLVKRLRELRSAPGEGGIPDFDGYVAVTTYNAINQLLRKLYPRRTSLKNKLRYVLEHHPALALRQDEDGKSLAGLKVWRDQREAMSFTQLNGLLEQPDELRRVNLFDACAATMPLVELLTALFELARRPIEFDDLIAVVAELCGIKDQPSVPVEEARGAAQLWAGGEQSAAELVERRELLRRAWDEIRQLPSRQRAAYLLNFKESQGYADLTTFLFTRTATPEEIAAALDMEIEELAELWPELPLDDAAIALRLGATQQQVISLRKFARDRLKRRLHIVKLVASAVGWLYPAAVHIFNK